MSAARKILALMGPTATGKTETAIALARELPVDLISVDSAMVYKGLDIGTAKPDAATLERYPHALIDIRDPTERYSVASFLGDAEAAAERAFGRGHVPLLVGGTMLYFKAFREGLATLPDAHPRVRDAIERRAQRIGWGALHRELERIDPVAAKSIHPNNPQRLSRALEVHEVTGSPISFWWQQQARGGVAERLDAHLVEVCLVPGSRALLHERIEVRLDAMFDAGFVDEVRRLKDRGDLDTDLPAVRAVGYRQVWDYLSGRLDLEAMRARAASATRQLAKRQLTWLRRWRHVEQFDMADAGTPAAILHYLRAVAIVP